MGTMRPRELMRILDEAQRKPGHTRPEAKEARKTDVDDWNHTNSDREEQPQALRGLASRRNQGERSREALPHRNGL